MIARKNMRHFYLTLIRIRVPKLELDLERCTGLLVFDPDSNTATLREICTHISKWRIHKSFSNGGKENSPSLKHVRKDCSVSIKDISRSGDSVSEAV